MIVRVRRRRERPERASVKAAEAGSDGGPFAFSATPGEFARKFDCGLRRFRPRIAEKDAGEAGTPREFARERTGRLVMKEVAALHERRGLFGDCTRDCRMRVSERAHGDPGDEIEVARALCVDQFAALAAHDLDRSAGVVGEQMGMLGGGGRLRISDHLFLREPGVRMARSGWVSSRERLQAPVRQTSPSWRHCYNREKIAPSSAYGMLGMRVKYEVSAGGLVLRRNGASYDALLIGRGEPRVWSLPKGHVEPRETHEQAALREVREETGCWGEILTKLCDISYWFYINGAKHKKAVHFYLMRYRSGDTANHDDEADEAAWFDLSIAKRSLKYMNEKRLIDLGLEYLAAQKIDPFASSDARDAPMRESQTR